MRHVTLLTCWFHKGQPGLMGMLLDLEDWVRNQSIEPLIWWYYIKRMRGSSSLQFILRGEKNVNLQRCRKKSQGVTKVSRFIVWAGKFHGNPSSSCCDISVWTEEVVKPTDILRAILIAWLKSYKVQKKRLKESAGNGRKRCFLPHDISVVALLILNVCIYMHVIEINQATGRENLRSLSVNGMVVTSPLHTLLHGCSPDTVFVEWGVLHVSVPRPFEQM